MCLIQLRSHTKIATITKNMGKHAVYKIKPVKEEKYNIYRLFDIKKKIICSKPLSH